MDNGTGLSEIWKGFTAIGDDPRIIAMWAISAALFYVGIARKKEPLLLIPISMGILLANMPLGVLISDGGDGAPVGFLKLIQDAGLNTDLLPLLIFLGLGAAVDFEPMLSNPKTLLLGAGNQLPHYADIRLQRPIGYRQYVLVLDRHHGAAMAEHAVGLFKVIQLDRPQET